MPSIEKKSTENNDNIKSWEPKQFEPSHELTDEELAELGSVVCLYAVNVEFVPVNDSKETDTEATTNSDDDSTVEVCGPLLYGPYQDNLELTESEQETLTTTDSEWDSMADVYGPYPEITIDELESEQESLTATDSEWDSMADEYGPYPEVTIDELESQLSSEQEPKFDDNENIIPDDK
jgi:hypothetical protein